MAEPGLKFEGEEAENVELIAQMASKGKNILDNADDIILVESESENVLDNVNLLGDEIVVRDGLPLKVPEIGMIFNDENELFDYYKKYAYVEGFPVRKRNSKKDDDGVVSYVTLTCSREGKRSSTTSGSLKPQPTIQTGCKARLTASPFVGINHHGQSTLLGCGLLSNEDTDTFVWLFKTWLQCMHVVAPQCIITDQVKAMQNAIAIVFPHTKHRWCLWHILKKLPERFGYHVDKGSIFYAIHSLVYDSQFVQEFEEGWRVMIDRYDLHDNAWLLGLYENRCR